MSDGEIRKAIADAGAVMVCKGDWSLGTACGKCPRCSEAATARLAEFCDAVGYPVLPGLRPNIETLRAWKRDYDKLLRFENSAAAILNPVDDVDAENWHAWAIEKAKLIEADRATMRELGGIVELMAPELARAKERIAELERQRDDLQAANNGLLTRARLAEGRLAAENPDARELAHQILGNHCACYAEAWEAPTCHAERDAVAALIVKGQPID